MHPAPRKTVEQKSINSARALITSIGFWGVPYYHYSIIYPQNPILITKAPILQQCDLPRDSPDQLLHDAEDRLLCQVETLPNPKGPKDPIIRYLGFRRIVM